MMLDGGAVLAFTAASLVVLALPGPGVLYVVTRSAAQGSAAGLVSVLGLSAGAFLQVIGATLGLSAILYSSATAFAVVKLIGAGYLIYLGLTTLLGRPAGASGQGALGKGAVPASRRRLFGDGVVVSLFNPKIALFFMAYLPQFVSLGQGPLALQVFWLGSLYVALALVTDGAYALAAGGVGRWIGGRLKGRRGGPSGSRSKFGPWPRYVTGGIYIGLGVKAAMGERQP